MHECALKHKHDGIAVSLLAFFNVFAGYVALL